MKNHTAGSPRMWGAAKMVGFLIIFPLVGFVLSFWFGIGWFLLFWLMRTFLLSIPSLRLPIVRILVSAEYAEKEKRRLAERGARWFTSLYAAVSIMVILMLTVYAFWKANVPLKALLGLMFR